MIIDKIEIKRGKTTVFAGEKAFLFAPEILTKYGIKEGETDGRNFFAAKEESDRLLCKRRLYALIDRSEKSKAGYVTALTDRGFSYAVACETADEAEQKGFIDDARFAECYIHGCAKNKGWYRIAAELKQKGVSTEIIESFREDFGDHTSECAKQADKYMRAVENTFENRQKTYAKLLRKGFSSDEIARALEKYRSDDDMA